MYYGDPSKKSLLEGMMLRKGLTRNDFVALFGFPGDVIGWDLLQPITSIYLDGVAEELHHNSQWRVGEVYECEHEIDNDTTVILKRNDGNNADLMVSYGKKICVKLIYIYNTESFTSIGIIYDPDGIKPGKVVIGNSFSAMDMDVKSFEAIKKFLIDIIWNEYTRRQKG
jgi:hypothetical protein